ncbi:MAG: hypothetical protein HZB16_15990 [Armatimonadetes bacterium]|nr:hypothetical protein [Armatimonadota bacterium]
MAASSGKIFRVLRIFLGSLLLLTVFIRRLGRRMSFGWSDRHTLAAAAGPLLVYAVLAFYAAHDAYHGEYPRGMGLVGLATLVWVWRLRRTLRRREAAAARPEVPLPAMGDSGEPAIGDEP